MNSHEYRKRFGTMEVFQQSRMASVGPLSFSIEQDGIRGVAWRGLEVVRGISVVLRDENWGVLPAEKVTDEIEETTDSFNRTRRSNFLNGALDVFTGISATADGRVDCTFELTANADAMVNRVGFTVLHPVMGVAGCPVHVLHGCGDQEDLHFPKCIAPAQPIFDIAGLSHQIATTQVSFEFAGEEFEMEDQRNWSDASFKTYSRPLSRPFPFRISKGEVIRQSVRLRVAEIDAVAIKTVKNSRPAVTKPRHAPDILLAAEGCWPCPDSLPVNGPINGIVLRLSGGLACSSDYLRALAAFALSAGAYIDVELIIEGGSGVTTQIENIASLLERAGISPRHVVALPEAYLKSYQPDGPWPAGVAPDECVAPARALFPDAMIGVGSLTNFTELNRCRPEPGKADYVTHGNAAIVHAADDRSVLETLEALPQIFDSAWRIAGDRGYRLGLVAIGMRGNPYGASLASNPHNIRKTMTADDPRQKGLFAAAYAIGVAVKAAQSGIGAVTLAGLGGPFSMRDQEVLFPLFHAVKALSALAGRKVYPMTNTPTGVVGLRFDEGVIIANCSPDPVELMNLPLNVAVLDVAQFEAASNNPDWLTQALEPARDRIILGGFACLFADTGAKQ